MPPFKHLLVPVDFDDAMAPAIDFALSLARWSDARVLLLHVFDLAPFVAGSPFAPAADPGPVLDTREREMAALRERLKASWPKLDALVREGTPAETIVDVASTQGADLIVIGTHGRRGLSHALLGSVAEKVVRLSPVPVLSKRLLEPAPKARH